MTEPVSKDRLAEFCARRMLNDIESDFGGIVDFSEKLTDFPEQYLLHMALSVIDCIDLSRMLNPPVKDSLTADCTIERCRARAAADELHRLGVR